MDDRELDNLLREWKAPDAPSHLRPGRARGSWARFLLTGTIRVPVPAALAALLLAGIWIGTRGGEPPSPPQSAVSEPSGELARYALTGPLDGFEVVLVALNVPGGRSLPEHRHPDFVLGYVADGRVRFSVNHEAAQVVEAGGTFFEPAGSVHTIFESASPDESVRVLVFLLVPTGSSVTEPA